MPGFDALAPDERAVLSLLLKQGKSYDEIAGLLRLESSSVRERALDALDALGAGTGQDLTPERQDELADHLLRQQSAAEDDGTRAFLEQSAPGRAWARAVAAELAPVAGDRLPDIPAEPVGRRRPAAEPVTAAAAPTASRRGGMLVLGSIALVLAVGAFLLIRGGGDDAPTTQAATPVAADGPTGTTGAGAAGLPQQQINLAPPSGRGGRALGYAIIAEGGFAFLAEGLPRRSVHRLWLYNSKSDALPLGNATYDAKTRRFQGALTALPEETARYGSLIVTRESGQNATDPGTIVLQGAIKRQ